jgi:hypothetical protein
MFIVVWSDGRKTGRQLHQILLDNLNKHPLSISVFMYVRWFFKSNSLYRGYYEYNKISAIQELTVICRKISYFFNFICTQVSIHRVS